MGSTLLLRGIRGVAVEIIKKWSSRPVGRFNQHHKLVCQVQKTQNQEYLGNQNNREDRIFVVEELKSDGLFESIYEKNRKFRILA